MCLFFSVIFGFIPGILYGALAGLLFGLIMAIFIQRQSSKFKKIEKEITNGDNIIFDGGANHFVGKEGVGGWMYLTDNEVIFQSHKLDFSNHKWAIKLSEIEEVSGKKTAKIINNGLVIKTINGDTETFVVNSRNMWIKKILDIKG
jgi:hypothetical protein